MNLTQNHEDIRQPSGQKGNTAPEAPCPGPATCRSWCRWGCRHCWWHLSADGDEVPRATEAGRERPPTPRRTPRRTSLPEHGLCPLRNAEDEASAAEHRPLTRVSASRAAVLPRPTPCSLTGSSCPSGLPVGAAHRPGVSTPRGDQVPALRWLCGRQLPPGPARAKASEAQPADGPSPGVLTGTGAAAPAELGLIHGRGRPSRGKQRVASGGLGGEEPPLISA